jgi:hypothetical protein
MIRPFELRDIPTLHRYRSQGLFLDSIPTLTWGRTLVPAGAMMSPISSAMGVFTSLYQGEEDGSQPIIGQVVHASGSPFARFTFIAPDSAIESPVLAPLVENLIKRVGERGAQSLIAEVDEKSFTFEALRRAHFSIYSRQRIWRLNQPPKGKLGKSPWRLITPIDEIGVRKLYGAMVPALVQQVEPAPWGRLRGYVYYEEGEMLAFVDVIRGPRGLWAQPFIHPELENVDLRLSQLLEGLSPRKNRPLYFCLRSYQAWLSVVMEEIQAEPGVSQAVMVRRLAASVKKAALSPIPQINSGTEPTTSFYDSPPQVEKQSDGVA